MMDTFGIFREDSLPKLKGNSKEVPSFIKGKGRVLNTKKKALGDVSNIVSQKAALTAKPNETGGILSAESCSGVQQGVSVSCKPVTVEKEIVEAPSEVKGPCHICYYDSGYDILSKSDRLSEGNMDLFCTSYLFRASSPPSTNVNYELPDFSPSFFLPPDIDDLPAEDVPIYDSDLSDTSF